LRVARVVTPVDHVVPTMIEWVVGKAVAPGSVPGETTA
jgi:hypothetical protein